MAIRILTNLVVVLGLAPLVLLESSVKRVVPNGKNMLATTRVLFLPVAVLLLSLSEMTATISHPKTRVSNTNQNAARGSMCFFSKK